MFKLMCISHMLINTSAGHVSIINTSQLVIKQAHFHLHVAGTLEKTRKHGPVPLPVGVLYHCPCQPLKQERN